MYERVRADKGKAQVINQFYYPLKVSLDEYCQIEQVGESSLLIRIKDCLAQEGFELSLNEKNLHIQRWTFRLLEAFDKGLAHWLKDYIVAYDSLLIEFDAYQIDNYRLIEFVKSLVGEQHKKSVHKTHQIKVCFEPISEKPKHTKQTSDTHKTSDLRYVCDKLDVSEGVFIDAFVANQFRVYALGFAPNFAYLGELPEKLALARRKTPRLQVPARALAIADRQCAIYPQSSPGGWNIIGYAAYKFSADQCFNPGDKISFNYISANDYLEWEETLNCKVNSP